MKNINLIVSFMLFSKIIAAQTGPAGIGNSTTNRMWLKADANVYKNAGTTLATNGSLVQQWNDQSGNNINATQGTSGNRPIYKTGIINGKPAIQFTGNTYLDGSALGIAGTGGFSFVFVTRATSYSAGGMFDGQGHYIMDRTLATNELTGLKITNTNKYGFQKRTNNGSGLNGPVSTSAINTAGFELINYRRDRGSAYHFFLNGTLESTLADGDGNLTPPIPRIGRHATTANYGLNGYISEMMIFSFDLNNAQINIVNSYLASKYNLTIANDKYTYDNTHETDVAGIGREDASNEHSDAQSAGILEINTPSSLDDNDYLLFGHDDDDITTWTTTEAPNNNPNINRLAREWRFNETGDIGTIKFTIDTTLLPARTINYTKFVLMVDSDGDFSNGASIYDLNSPAANNYFETAANITIADGDFVAIGEVLSTGLIEGNKTTDVRNPSGSSSYSFSHTQNVGANGCLVVVVAVPVNSTTSVTYGGVSMTNKRNQSTPYSTNWSVWELKNPPTGANTIQINLSSGGWNSTSAVCYSFIGCSGVGNTGYNGSQAVNQSTSLTISNNSMIIGTCIGGNSTSAYIGIPQGTNRPIDWNHNINNKTWGGISPLLTAGSKTIKGGSTAANIILGIEVQEATTTTTRRVFIVN
ncbi:MAG: hypothetical protein P8Q41_03390 [Saprospiraceae bacterium]|nr:hypothetical protein [Saprospiraceae bacterium]